MVYIYIWYIYIYGIYNMIYKDIKYLEGYTLNG